MNVIRESGDYYKYIMDVDDAKKEGKIGLEQQLTFWVCIRYSVTIYPLFEVDMSIDI